MKFAALLFVALSLPLGIPVMSATDAGSSPARPNILWLVTEDISPSLGAYGDPDAITPALDALAARGVRYTRAFSVAGVCAPSRSSIITSMYASSLGSQHMRCEATLPQGLKLLPQRLRESGYYCSNNFKEDYNFKTPSGAWDESSRAAHWRKRQPGQPFFSVFNFMVTHERYLRASDELYARITQKVKSSERRDPGQVHVPAWLPDTPAVRREWARYHEMITAMDHRVAELLAELEEDGLADNTIVLFFSDHGAAFPRAKQFLYDSGTHVPLLVYCPPRWRHLLDSSPGTTTDRLVSLVDLAPTMLRFVGLKQPEMMQGEAFLAAPETPTRTMVPGIRDRMDERFDFSRTMRDGRFKYFRNFRPDLPHFPWLDYMDQLDTSKEFRRLAANDELPAGLKLFMAPRQPLEELYDIVDDPDELRNLADDPTFAEELDRMRQAYFEWARATRDTGFIPEQMLRDFATGSSEYEYAHSSDYRLEECIAVTRLMERGVKALPELRQALSSTYAPVRYWAAVGLSVLGDEAAPARTELERALSDPEAEVALAAAEACGRSGDAAPALAVIAHWLENGRPLEALAAANVADRLGEAVRPIAGVIRRVAGQKPVGDLGLMRQWALLHQLRTLDAPWEPMAQQQDLVEVGLAKRDITPTHPVRLHAFPRGDRIPETSEVTQRIHAKALAIGTDEEKPVLLVTTDLLGVSEEMSAELARRLVDRGVLSDRAHLTLTATHNHSAPALATVAPYVFRQPATEEAAQNIRRYGEWLMDRLEEVSLAALADRRPAQLHLNRGQLDFSVNRRVIENGKWTGFGINPTGPVDPDFPLLAVRDPNGRLRGVWMSYACHGVCWRKPSVHGDWMGVAQQLLEREFPGVIACVTIGCAGDQNPRDAEGNDPDTPGMEMAIEARRLIAQPAEPLRSVPSVRMERFALPLQPIPPLEDWSKRSDWFSTVMQARLTRGEPVAQEIPYVIQAWVFDHDLAIAFLGGEVFSGYGLRLKRELDGKRLWINAYANAMPAYIPTADAIPEGGFEIDASRWSYGVPARFSPEIEDQIVKAVKELLPEFSAPTRQP